MNISNPVNAEINAVSFSFYDSEEVKKISVKHIVNPQLLDNLNHPSKGGLYDPALGPFTKNHVCATCSLDYFSCPGHFGHIELPCPVTNPLVFKYMFGLMRAKCFYCHRFRTSRAENARYIAKLNLLQAGLVLEALEVDNMVPNFKNKKSSADDEDESVEDIKIETEEEYIERIDSFVKHSLENAPDSASKDYKVTLINEERRKVQADFVKRACGKRRCDNCTGYAPSLRNDGYTKVFKQPLPKKYQAVMDAKGMTESDVLQKKAKQPKRHYADAEMMDVDEEEEVAEAETEMEIASEKKTAHTFMTPLHLRNHITLLFENEKEISNLLYGKYDPISQTYTRASPNMFFIEVLPVPPTRFRPASVFEDEIMENPQNVYLGQVLATCNRLRDINVAASGGNDKIDGVSLAATDTKMFSNVINTWIQLQQDVNNLIDSSKNPNLGTNGAAPPPGIRQTLEKKEGLFRKHMMGKRVNYSARSVISPDPNIETSEIGIPPVFASKLTYPEPVTHYNVKEMRRAVINGPDQWPGASHVQHEDGTLTSLGNLSLESRIALANQLLTPQETSTNTSAGGAFTPRITGVNKKVLRHLKNGDLLLLNRQPTLHKPSIMAHRARVLPGEKTIRMHYANCNTYNADFDGDEMNIHFPQNEIARAEALLIANTDSQYLVPTNGSPLRGLIQDHVVVGVWMTSKDTFFTREEYQQVIYGALRPEEDESGNGKIDTVPPSIWKPEPLWTGKQIISTILKNLTKGLPQANVKSKAKVPARYWGPGSEEQNVLVMDGELLCGVLDKSQFGASAFGLVHSVYELYGPSYAGKLLSIFGRLFTKYVQMRGFTCRMDDLRLTEEGDQWRRDLLQKGQFFGRDASRDYVGLKNVEEMSSEQVETEYKHRMEEVLRSNEKMAGLDAAMKSKMNGLTSSIINKCLPAGLLRVFPDNNMQMMTISGAKGSNVNVSQISCLLGQQELEGRRVPTMVSGKTLPSFLPFDSSARAGGFIAGRFLTGIRPQEYFFHCMAGREGLIDTAVKTANSGYLQRCLIKHLEGLRVHYDHTVRDSDGSILQFQYGEDALDVIKQKHLNEFSFIASNYAAFIKKQQPQKALAVLELEEASSYSKKALKKPSKYDPVLSKFNPSRNLGAVSEKFQTSLDNYLEQNSEKLIVTKENSNNPNVRFPDLNKKKFKALMHLKYLQSLADPGEAVGLLAAQGVGEPSTQMTLNTFHFAGFGAKNVTLGIPRLREIVMTASANIKTPSMTLPLHPHIADDEAHGFCQDISKLTLAAIMDDVLVKEQMTKLTHSGGRRVKAYKIRLNFFTKKEYRDEYNLEPSMVQHAIEKSFVSKLERAIVRDLKKVYRGSANAEEEEEIGKPLRTARPKASQENEEVEAPAKAVHDDSDEEDEDSEVGDNDADDAKRASKRQEKATYDGPDEEDEAMIAEMNKELESDGESSESEPEELENLIEGQESAEHKARAGRIVDNSLYVKRYKFDEKNGSYCEIEMQFPADTKKILMVGIVEKICHETVIHEVKGIDRCFPFINEAENDTSKQLATDGVNLRGMWNYPETIDLNNIYTNDVAAILRTYGVEAARNAITKEIGGVFGVYGIEVDPRHLSLIADYMTFEGGYKPFNRMGIESNVSPFLKMSFETTCHFLTNATVHGDYDTMASPSARIVVGKVVEGGTGSFEIRQPLTVQ